MIRIYRPTVDGYRLSRSIAAPDDDLKWKVLRHLAFVHSATLDELKNEFGNTLTLQNALSGLIRHRPRIVIVEGAELL